MPSRVQRCYAALRISIRSVGSVAAPRARPQPYLWGVTPPRKPPAPAKLSPKGAAPAAKGKGQAPARAPAKGKPGKRAPLPAPAQILTREQWPIRPISGWTAEAIMAAREAHDQGQWAQAESLYAALRTIDRIHAALESRCNAVRAFGFALTCPRPGEAPARLCEAAATLHESWPAVVMSEMTRSEIIERVVMFGFCLARVQWISISRA